MKQFVLAVLLTGVAAAQGTIGLPGQEPVQLFPGGNKFNSTGGILNMKDPKYGVQGNGVTDDTNAVYAVMRAAQTYSRLSGAGLTAGVTVFVPTGIYLIHPTGTQNRVMSSGVSLFCEPGAVFKRMDATYTNGASSEDTLFRNANTGAGDKDISIRGCTFDGNARGNPIGPGAASQSPLVRFDSVVRFHVEDNNFLDSHTQGFMSSLGLDGDISGNNFHRMGQPYCSVTAGIPCAVDGDCPVGEVCPVRTGDPIQVNATNNTTIANNIISNGGEGIFCQHLAAPATVQRNCRILGNHLLRTTVANQMCTGNTRPYTCCTGAGAGTGAYGTVGGGLCAIGISQGSGLGMLGEGGVIADNTFESFPGIIVSALSTHGNLPTRDIVIKGNTIRNSVGSVAGVNGGIVLYAQVQTVERVTVADNIMFNSYGAGVAVGTGGASGTVKQVSIHGNQIVGSGIGLVYPGIHLDAVAAATTFTDITIDGNNIQDGAGFGIGVEGTTTDVKIRDNVIKNQTAGMFDFTAPATVADWARNGAVTLAQLGALATATVGDGSLAYCSGCNIANPCAAGTGAFAKRIAGAWVCN